MAVTVGTGILAVGAGRGWTTIWAVAAVFAGQLFVGWTNDYLDRDFDRRAGRQDKPAAAGEIDPRRLPVAAAIALVLCVPLSMLNGIAPGLIHLAAVGLATAYNLGLKATVFSAAPFALAFGAVPAFVTLGLAHPHLPPLWATGACALLGAGAHFTQVLPDIESDRELGQLGLPQRLGPTASVITTAVMVAAAGLLVALGPGQPGQLQLVFLAVVLLLAAGIVAAGLRGRRKLAFRLTIAGAAGVAAVFLTEGRLL
jgi:4-hydroxybenzoate polyprenyltransferase